MKKLILSAFALALISAAPAYAQSSFVMIIGEAPTASAKAAETTPETHEALVARTVESTCVRPTIRNLRAMVDYRECADAVRAELADAALAPEQLAAR